MEKTEKKPIDVEAELSRLQNMTVPQLRQRHRELFGEEATSHHRQHLVRRMAWRLQAEIEGDLPEDLRQHALSIARDSTLRSRIADNASRRRGGLPPDRTAITSIAPMHDSRLPLPGSLLTKEYKGETHVVKVLDDGFEYAGQVFRSLSAVAQQITGTKWNGFLFFGVAKEDRVARNTTRQRSGR